MKRLLLVLLVLTGCDPEQPPPNCLSTCGAGLYQSTDCEGFEAAERRLVDAVHELGLWERAEACEILRGASIVVLRPGEKGDGSFDDPWQGGDATIGGYTKCGRGGSGGYGLVIGNDDWFHNAYSHESVHLFEGCYIKPDTNDPHAHWPGTRKPEVQVVANTQPQACKEML